MVKKITLFLGLLVGFFILFSEFPQSAYATKEGYVDCGRDDPLNPGNCINCISQYATCIQGCPQYWCDCSFNCPGGPPPGGGGGGTVQFIAIWAAIDLNENGVIDSWEQNWDPLQRNAYGPQPANSQYHSPPGYVDWFVNWFGESLGSDSQIDDHFSGIFRPSWTTGCTMRAEVGFTSHVARPILDGVNLNVTNPQGGGGGGTNSISGFPADCSIYGDSATPYNEVGIKYFTQPDDPYRIFLSMPSGWEVFGTYMCGNNHGICTYDPATHSVLVNMPQWSDAPDWKYIFVGIAVKKSAGSCTVSLTPNPGTVANGSAITYTASVVPTGSTVDSVNFSSANSAVATVNPATKTVEPYQTAVTGESVGSTSITADVYMNGVVKCTDTATVNVVNPGPWWQVKDADVTTFGNLTSLIPGTCSLPGCDPVFDIAPVGGYPGVPVFGGTASFGSGGGTVSTLGWLANTTASSARQYTYAWFKRLIPGDVTYNQITSPTINGTDLSSGGTASGGYYYYLYDGSSGIDLTIDTDVSLGTRRVILLVDGANLNLNARVNFTKGQGFFMAIVGKTLLGAKGDINVSSSLGGGATPQLEGLYEADNAFHTGAGTTQLYIRGSVAAYGGISLERDLADDSVTPAEVFEYAPDLVFTYPYKLRERHIFWQEVAP